MSFITMHFKLPSMDMHRHKNPGAGKNTALLTAGLISNTDSYKSKASLGFSVILALPFKGQRDESEIRRRGEALVLV